MENELAIMAIKGGRFLEAESIFNEDLKKEANSQSFFGLGVCKLNLLLDINRTPEEVAYCFEKALKLSDETTKQDLIFQASVFLKTILGQYKDLYIELEARKKAEAVQALVGLGLTLGAAAIGSSKGSNAFTQIASLAVAGAGVGISLDGLKNMGAIPEIQNHILKIGNSLISEFSRLGITSIETSNETFNSSELLLLTSTSKKEDKEASKKVLLYVMFFFSIHRFYVGKWKSGLLYIFTFGGLGIWFILDLIKLIKGEFDPKW